jgi:hypothetical protein
MAGGKGDAEVVIGADASAVERAAAVGKAAWKDFGTSLQSSIGTAAQSVITDLGQVALAAGKISFSSQHQQVRELESSTAHLATSMRRSLEGVRSEYESTGISIGKRPAEVAAWASEVGKLTYNYGAAGEAIKGISGLAAETGRSVNDYKGLAVELGTVGKVGGDTTHVLGVMQAQVDTLGNAGGIAAFADQVTGLSDVISHFAISSEQDFARVTALAAELGKGLSPQAAGRVQQKLFGDIASDPMGWSRYLGHDITDEHGHVEKPEKVLEEITRKIKRTYGKDSRRMLMIQFGSEAGAAAYNADFKHAAELAGVAPSGAQGAAQQALNATDAGKRDIAGAELAKSSRELLGSSTLLGRAADALQRFASHNPITSTLVASALGAGASTFMTTFGQSIATMMGGKGLGGAAGGAVDLATKGAGAPLGGAMKAIPIVGSFVAGAYAGGEMGAALDDWQTQTFDKPREAQEKVARDQDMIRQKEIRDRVRAARGAATLPGGYTPAAEDSQLARVAGGGSKEGLAALIAKLEKEGESKTDAERIAKAVADALSKMQVQVTNASDTPVTATIKSSSSATAGSQGHT